MAAQGRSWSLGAVSCRKFDLSDPRLQRQTSPRRPRKLDCRSQSDAATNQRTKQGSVDPRSRQQRHDPLAPRRVARIRRTTFACSIAYSATVPLALVLPWGKSPTSNAATVSHPRDVRTSTRRLLHADPPSRWLLSASTLCATGSAPHTTSPWSGTGAGSTSTRQLLSAPATELPSWWLVIFASVCTTSQ